MPRPLPSLILLLTCATAQAGELSTSDQARQAQLKADYGKHLDALAQPQSLLEKVRAWQNAAEANSQAIVTLPKGTHPPQAPARALAIRGAQLLRQQRGNLPKGADWADFPVAVEIEVLHARTLLFDGQAQAAQKELEAVVGAAPGTRHH